MRFPLKDEDKIIAAYVDQSFRNLPEFVRKVVGDAVNLTPADRIALGLAEIMSDYDFEQLKTQSSDAGKSPADYVVDLLLWAMSQLKPEE